MMRDAMVIVVTVVLLTALSACDKNPLAPSDPNVPQFGRSETGRVSVDGVDVAARWTDNEVWSLPFTEPVYGDYAFHGEAENTNEARVSVEIWIRLSSGKRLGPVEYDLAPKDTVEDNVSQYSMGFTLNNSDDFDWWSLIVKVES